MRFAKGENGTMRFHFETMPLTGRADVISIQSIGMSEHCFVIEAETEDEARDKLLDLLEKRVWEGWGQGWVRPATEEESEEFEYWQDDAKKGHEWAARFTQDLEESHGKK
jgi:hypothetical protein